MGAWEIRRLVHRRSTSRIGQKRSCVAGLRSLPGCMRFPWKSHLLTRFLTFQIIVKRAARLLNAPGGSLSLCDQERQEVTIHAESYPLKKDYTGVKVKYGEGAAGGGGPAGG